MGKKKEATKVTSLLDVGGQAASVLEHLYTLKVLTPEEVETEFTVDENGKKILCVRTVETEEKVAIFSEMVAGLLKKGITVHQWGNRREDGTKSLLCEFYYE